MVKFNVIVMSIGKSEFHGNSQNVLMVPYSVLKDK